MPSPSPGAPPHISQERPTAKLKRPQNKPRLVLLGGLLAMLTAVWWFQRRDRMDVELLQAVLDGDAEKAHSLLASGADPNVRFSRLGGRTGGSAIIERVLILLHLREEERIPNDKTAILLAAASDRAPIVRDLIRHGANVNVRMGTGTTPLLTAAGRNHSDTALLLLQAGADWRVRGFDGLSPVQIAARSGNARLLEACIQKGASVLEKDKRGWTLLGLAGEKRQDECVRVLLAHGARLEELAAVSREPLLWASQSGCCELVGRIWDTMERGRRRTLGAQALYHAVNSGEIKTVRALLEREAPVNPVLPTDPAPLEAAATGSHPELIAELIRRGARVNARSGYGGTALHRCAYQPERVRILLGYGADPNIQDVSGRTPLMDCSSKESLQLLLAAGANPNLRDRTGTTALGYNFATGVPQLLVQHHADPNIADIEGVTPLMKAITMQNVDAVKALIAGGARSNDADARGRTALSVAQGLLGRQQASLPPQVQAQLDDSGIGAIVRLLQANGALATVPRTAWRGTLPPMSRAVFPPGTTKHLILTSGRTGTSGFQASSLPAVNAPRR